MQRASAHANAALRDTIREMHTRMRAHAPPSGPPSAALRDALRLDSAPKMQTSAGGSTPCTHLSRGARRAYDKCIPPNCTPPAAAL